jgi:hypothetical protein
MHGVGFDGVRKPGMKDLVFAQNGLLRIEPGTPDHLDIEVGKEYFILLYCVAAKGGFRYFFQLMDKEHFYYKML